MKSKRLFPHAGKGYLELDRRVMLLFSLAAKAKGFKQDELMAGMLLECFDDEKEMYGKLYKDVEVAFRKGEFARKNAKNKTLHITHPLKEENLTPDGIEVTEDLRKEWESFLQQ